VNHDHVIILKFTYSSIPHGILIPIGTLDKTESERFKQVHSLVKENNE
jgi:hypothetical protein